MAELFIDGRRRQHLRPQARRTHRAHRRRPDPALLQQVELQLTV
ncbi:hypothetical protein ACGFOU_20235 [Streptomyces sp. NPDC048595]